MKKITLLIAGSLLATSLLQAQLTVDDNKYINAYNKEINALNRNFGALRTLDDYKNPQKRAKVEENFNRVRKVIKSFSDQKDRQVVSMQRSYKSMVSTYNKNLKIAGVTAKSPSKTKSNKSTRTSGETLSSLRSAFNKNLRSATNAVNGMRSPADFASDTKQKELKKYHTELKNILAKIEKKDANTYASAKRNFANWESYYVDLARDFTGPHASENRLSGASSASDVMTSTDKYNLKKFRSEYISNDYLFRSIDSVALQDPKYRAQFETALKTLQNLLNPMRSKTFDRGVARADSDLKKLEDAYAQAMAKSKKQAAAVTGDVSKELKAIQSVFNQQNFDPRLLRNYITSEILPLNQVESWAKEMKRYKTLYPKMLSFLQNVQNNSVEGRKPEFSRYAYWFETQVVDKINGAITDKKRELDTEIFNGITKYRNYSKSYMNRIFSNINSAQRDITEMLSEYHLGKKALENLMVIEKTIDGAPSAKSLQAQKDYALYGKILQKAKRLSLQNQKMPRAATNDAKLMAITKSLLPSSVFTSDAALRITNDVKRFRSLDYSQALGWHIMDYSAFAVAYAKKEGSTYRIKTVTFRRDNPEHYNRSHGGKWYLSSQTPAGYGIEIPKENIR